MKYLKTFLAIAVIGSLTATQVTPIDAKQKALVGSITSVSTTDKTEQALKVLRKNFALSKLANAIKERTVNNECALIFNPTQAIKVLNANSYKKEKKKVKVKIKEAYVCVSKTKVQLTSSRKSDVIDELLFNEKIEYEVANEENKAKDGWGKLTDDSGYVDLDDFSSKGPEYKTVTAVNSTGVKSMESYRVFRRTGTNLTNQGKLQNLAETDRLGFRTVNGRYCIAVGSAVCGSVGTYIDLVLENGVIIPCIMGDQKADCHTYRDNQKSFNGCISEFIVDLKTIDTTYGDVSYVQTEEDWKSPVVEFRVYKQNILEED